MEPWIKEALMELGTAWLWLLILLVIIVKSKLEDKI